MKQHITLSQLKEITKVQYKKLYELNRNPFLSRIAYEEEYNFKISESDYIESASSMSIGTMIEMLNTKKNKDTNIELTIMSTGYTYVGIVFDEYNNKVWFEGKELCDVLWDAVKSKISPIEIERRATTESLLCSNTECEKRWYCLRYCNYLDHVNLEDECNETNNYVLLIQDDPLKRLYENGQSINEWLNK